MTNQTEELKSLEKIASRLLTDENNIAGQFPGVFRDIELMVKAIFPKEAEDAPINPEIYSSSYVSATDQRGWVKLNWGLMKCKMTPDEARAFALTLLQCAEAAQGDECLFAVGGINAVRALRAHREQRFSGNQS